MTRRAQLGVATPGRDDGPGKTRPAHGRRRGPDERAAGGRSARAREREGVLHPPAGTGAGGTSTSGKDPRAGTGTGSPHADVWASGTPAGRTGHAPSWTRPRWTRRATSSEPKRRSPGVTVQQQHETRTGRDTTKTVVPNSLTVGFVLFQLKGNNLPLRSRAAWKKRLAGEQQVRSGDLRLSRPPRVFFRAGRSQRAAVTGGCQPRGADICLRHVMSPFRWLLTN